MAFDALASTIKADSKNRYNKTTSTKGAVCLESTLDPVVDLYTGIKPGTSRTNIDKLIDSAVTSYRLTGNVNTIIDIATIIFQKRSIQEGEARRDEPRLAFLKFYQHFPIEALQLLPLFTDKNFGYWQDLNQIWREVCNRYSELHKHGASRQDAESFYKYYNPLISKIINLFMTQRACDLEYLISGNHNKISMCAKWILSENSAGNKPQKATRRSAKRTAAALAKINKTRVDGSLKKRKYKMRTKSRDTPIFWFYKNKYGRLVKQTYVAAMIRPTLQEKGGKPWLKDIPFRARKEYRKGNSALRSALTIVESLICSKIPSAIDPSKLTGKNLSRYSKYLYNEKTTPPGCNPIKVSEHEQDTGNREPNNPERVALRKRTKEFFTSPKAVEMLKNKMQSLTPLEIYINVKNSRTSETQRQQAETMWKAMTMDTLEKINEFCAENNIQCRKVIPMVDMSGSMSTYLPGITQPTSRDMYGGIRNGKTVSDAAMSLGIMAATAKHESDPLYGVMLSFSREPVWFNLPRDASLKDMIKSVDTNTRGDRLNTDFYKAYMEVIQKVSSLVKAGLMLPEEITQIVILALSDLQFDSISCPGYDSNWDTTYQRLEKEAVKHGLPALPTMIFWNLNNAKKSIQTTSTKRGVEFLSGYSQNNIRHAFYGPSEDEELSVVMIDSEPVLVSKTTPRDKMLKIIYQPFFDPVREVFTKMTNGPFATYTFVREESEDEHI